MELSESVKKGKLVTKICFSDNVDIEIQCKKGMYFSFDFIWYSIHPDIVH